MHLVSIGLGLGLCVIVTPHAGSLACMQAEEGERRLASRYGPVVATHGSGAAAGELSLAAITGAKGGRKPRRVSVTAGGQWAEGGVCGRRGRAWHHAPGLCRCCMALLPCSDTVGSHETSG